jgi:hypothetical protein
MKFILSALAETLFPTKPKVEINEPAVTKAEADQPAPPKERNVFKESDYQESLDGFLQVLKKANVEYDYIEGERDESKYEPFPVMKQYATIKLNHPHSATGQNHKITIEITQAGSVGIRSNLPIMSERDIERSMANTTDEQELKAAEYLRESLTSSWNQTHKSYVRWLDGDSLDEKLDNARQALRLTTDGKPSGPHRSFAPFAHKKR